MEEKYLVEINFKLISIVFTLILTIIGYFYWRLKRKFDIQQKKLDTLDERTWRYKKELYDKIYKIYAILIKSIKSEQPNSKEIETLVHDVQNVLCYYASDGVVMAWAKWRRNNCGNFKDLTEVFIEIRKDVGFPNTKVTSKTFANVFTNGDISPIFKKTNDPSPNP